MAAGWDLQSADGRNHPKPWKSWKINEKSLIFFEISIRDRLECSNRCGIVHGRSWEYCEAVEHSLSRFYSHERPGTIPIDWSTQTAPRAEISKQLKKWCWSEETSCFYEQTPKFRFLTRLVKIFYESNEAHRPLLEPPARKSYVAGVCTKSFLCSFIQLYES